MEQKVKCLKTRLTIFIKVFNFVGLKLASIQALFHFLQPLLDFFNQVMHFLQIYIGRFNRHISQVLTNFVISCGILAHFGKNMIKIGSFKIFFQI